MEKKPTKFVKKNGEISKKIDERNPSRAYRIEI